MCLLGIFRVVHHSCPKRRTDTGFPVWTAREEAIRSAAYRLDFQRTGRAIREAFKSAINGAIRRGLIERQGPLLIRKVKEHKQ